MNWAHSSLSEVWCIISSPIRVQTFTWLLRDSDWSILDKVFCKSRKGRLTDTDLRYHVSPAFTRNMPSLNLKTGKGQMTVCVFLIHRLCKSIVIQNNVSRFLEFVSEGNEPLELVRMVRCLPSPLSGHGPWCPDIWPMGAPGPGQSSGQ